MSNLFDFNCPKFVDFQECANLQTENSLCNDVYDDLLSPELNKKAKVKRRSRSVGNLDDIKSAFKKPLPLNQRKRSLSETEVTKPKRTLCATPLYLKKNKTKQLKSWEELELEKIAELQKQTRMHLRQNENFLRRMNLKPKPSCISSLVSKTAVPSKRNQKDLAGPSNIKETIPNKVGRPTDAKKLLNNDVFLKSKHLKNDSKPAQFNFKAPSTSSMNDCKADRKNFQTISVKPQPWNPSTFLPLRTMNSQRNVSRSESDTSLSFNSDLGVNKRVAKPRSVFPSQESNKENAFEKFKAAYAKQASKPLTALVSQLSNNCENLKAACAQKALKAQPTSAFQETKNENAFEKFKAAYALRALQKQ